MNERMPFLRMILGFWALFVERVALNVEGERRYISDALRRALSSLIYVIYTYPF